ncbi:MAG TPA: CoA-transferase [Acidimicrobiales bacterium]|jgi:acyl CoA:acetate/3-ketoacid CoA transferase alpha subunit/acyl CoA:acetate/3-ketoacid CoA transferase beta subunit
MTPATSITQGPAFGSLSDAIAQHVHPGDSVQVMLGHSRWTAGAREMARQFWGQDAGLTLIMTSLGALGALFFRGGLVRKVVTTYSGNSFPTYTPNPIFRKAYESGEVEVEHWSILTLAQRMEAAARGLPATVTGSLVGSSMADNEGFEVVDSPFGPLGLLSPLAPDVALLHAAVADRAGNLALSEPLLEGVWGAWAARRGVVATVEKVVNDLDGLGHRVRIPAHRVLAVVEAPYGAHPGGCYAPGLPVTSYGEDISYWNLAAEAAAKGEFDAFAQEWVLGPSTHDDYLAKVGVEHLRWLEGRSNPASWKDDAAATPAADDPAVTTWEQAAVLGAREVELVVADVNADAVLAGAGVANLSAWVAVGRARAAGSRVVLTAELGLWGYEPTPADPYIFNHRVFPGTPYLSDASSVLGMVIGGPGTKTVGCLGAAEVDRHGCLNSTELAGGRFLVGSGGANDVASRADACVVVTLARPERLPDRVAYITSPGHQVVSVVTDKGILRRHDGEFRVAAVPAGAASLDERVRQFVSACGYTPEVARTIEDLAPVQMSEVLALREFDRQRLFLN